jgi:hypothetical protein
MNKKKALRILGFEDSPSYYTIQEELKSRYRMYALMYHPDKNKSVDAAGKFLEVKEAYDYLSSELETDDMEEDNIGDEDDVFTSDHTKYSLYNTLLKYVMGSVYQNHKDKIDDILDKILAICEKQSIQVLYKIEWKKFQIIYNIFKKYGHVFFLSEEFLREMDDIYHSRMNPLQPETMDSILSNGYDISTDHLEMTTEMSMDNMPIITLYPTLDNLWDNMLFKLKRENQLYLVPLWYSELVYECNSSDFIVKCIPKIPLEENVYIDDQNNIHKNITYSITQIWDSRNEPIFSFHLGKKSFSFDSSQLRICEKQTIEWNNEGLPKMNDTIHDVSEKSNIYLHILLIY